MKTGPKIGTFILIVIIAILAYAIKKDNVRVSTAGTEVRRIEPGEGSPTYTIVTDTEQRAYNKLGEQMSIEELQELIGVKVDGKAGMETCLQVMRFNRLDEIK